MASNFPTAGLQFLVDLLDPSSGVAKLTNIYVAWGTGTGQTIASTTLGTESAETRVATTNSQVTVVQTGDTYQGVATIVSSGGQTISEAGLFSASTTGTMLLYGDFTGIPVVASDSIEFTCKLQVTNA